MALYETEDEQLEAFRRWWRKNGRAVISGIAIGLALAFAGWAWRDYVQTQAQQASVKYQRLIDDLEKGSVKAVMERGERIRRQYGNTPYAVFAALAMARVAVQQDDNSSARDHLQWVLEEADRAELRHIARLRLARVMLDSGQQKEALQLLEERDPGRFVASYEEIRGDAYRALNQLKAAQASYERALAKLPSNASRESLLRMKLEALRTTSGDSKAKVSTR